MRRYVYSSDWIEGPTTNTVMEGLAYVWQVYVSLYSISVPFSDYSEKYILFQVLRLLIYTFVC